MSAQHTLRARVGTVHRGVFDATIAPVLTIAEAPQHQHMAARKTFVHRHGVTQPAPAPRFSRTPSAIRESVTAEISSLIKEWQKS